MGGRNMRQCPSCGFTTDTSDLTCPVCGKRLPLNLGLSSLTIRKIGLALLIPFLVWVVMTTFFGW